MNEKEIKKELKKVLDDWDINAPTLIEDLYKPITKFFNEERILIYEDFLDRLDKILERNQEVKNILTENTAEINSNIDDALHNLYKIII